ncbi:MAG TPA: Na+/H+ antiporter subunit E [Capillimicrobium sp.]|nr:Na+/H+ antiporter subunit E [Capillimicrobium sp.]
MIHLLRAGLVLGIVYCFTLASTDPVDLAIGTGLGIALVAALGVRLELGPAAGALPPFAQRALWFPVFLAAIVGDVIASTWDVALRILHLRSVRHAGLVRVPIGERTDRGIAVSGLVISLSPGAVLVDVDWDRRDLIVHVIDASDPDDVRARLQRFYDRYQRRVLP